MKIQNPFSPTGLPTKEVVFWADRKQLKEKLLRYVQSAGTPNVQTLLLLGEYGSGKTHTMHFLRIFCEQTSPSIPVVLVPSPGSSFLETTRKIIEIIGFDQILLTFDKFLTRNRERILSALKEDAKEDLMRIESISTERIIQHSFPDFDSDLAIILAQIYNHRNLDLCRTWILGRNLTRVEMGILNVSKSIVSDETAVKVLGDILRMIIAQYSQMVLMIDEFEDISNLPKSEVINYCQSMRKFIDLNIPNLKIIIAWVGTSYQEFEKGTGDFARGKTYHALTDRLRYNQEIMEPLKGADLVEYVFDFISKVYDGNLEEVVTKKAIALLEHTMDTYPRQLNIVFHRAIEMANDRNRYPIDDRSLVEALRQTGVTKSPKVA